MPLPSKKTSESKEKFMDRCVSDDVMKSEFTDIKQRIAVCLSQFKKKEKKDGDS
jgi:hypothetical protein